MDEAITKPAYLFIACEPEVLNKWLELKQFGGYTQDADFINDLLDLYTRFNSNSDRYEHDEDWLPSQSTVRQHGKESVKTPNGTPKRGRPKKIVNTETTGESEDTFAPVRQINFASSDSVAITRVSKSRSPSIHACRENATEDIAGSNDPGCTGQLVSVKKEENSSDDCFSDFDVKFACKTEMPESPLETSSPAPGFEPAVNATTNFAPTTRDSALPIEKTTIIRKAQVKKVKKNKKKKAKMKKTKQANMKKVKPSKIKKVKIKAIKEILADSTDVNANGDMELMKKKKNKRLRNKNLKPTVCEFCGKEFMSANGLRTHVKFHDFRPCYTCSYCNYSFMAKFRRDTHEKMHMRLKHPVIREKNDPKEGLYYLENKVEMPDRSGTKQVFKSACNVCGRMIGLNQMWDHLQTHQNKDERKISCSMCGYLFAGEHSLTRHIRVVHEKSQACVCDVCGKGFEHRGLLNRHSLVHTGEKPYPCSFCEKRFSSNTNREQHENVHRGIKNYHCEFCGKAFSQCAALTQHRRQHTGFKVREKIREETAKRKGTIGGMSLSGDMSSVSVEINSVPVEIAI